MKGKTLWIVLAATVAAVLVIGVAFLLMGHPKPPVPPAPPPPVAVQPAAPPAPPPAVSNAPFSFSSTTDRAVLSLKLPPSLVDEPQLHDRLYAEGVKELKKSARSALAADPGPTDGSPPRGMEWNVKWTTAAETGKLLSLHKQGFVDEGGAHPNSFMDGLLWDRSTKKTVQPAALFKKNVDYGRLDATLCQAVKDARKKRLGADYSEDPSTWPCPKWAKTPVVLAPSTTPGKAGGLTFLFPPYAVGPYSDGAFEITVPLSAFRADLAPAYADEFAGAPPRTGDTTPSQ
jgi:hypothetical protein